MAIRLIDRRRIKINMHASLPRVRSGVRHVLIAPDSSHIATWILNTVFVVPIGGVRSDD